MMGTMIDIDSFYKRYMFHATNKAEAEFNQIIREIKKTEAIPKEQYEARLKADMVAMLKNLRLEIEKTAKEEELIDKKWAKGLHYSEKIIQQKIRELEGNQ